ncbi:MAG: hypothetical protein QXX08_07975 [Candidatus Bathyarchaeia archaeon]
MKYRWIRKQVDLAQIENAARNFLQQHKFTTASYKNCDQRKIIGVLKDKEERKKVAVTITGSPQDFIVDFSAGESAQLIAKFASLITFFGGGAFGLKSLKEKEFYQKLEDKFWNYLEELIEKQSRK